MNYEEIYSRVTALCLFIFLGVLVNQDFQDNGIIDNDLVLAALIAAGSGVAGKAISKLNQNGNKDD